ncbi:MAG: polyprenyl synthetase family protein [Aliifodinibius sp.]|nr:polyprenyl synthetase family protein [candidate division Zixibacteria bacterium]NIT61133.1 polyprenyl synthetase family protein [Fodinibius sp.]NIS48589.1 polyprenyl synthetase family protein [candidate division Zixibacteria bacterium]NIU13124.1 polyprenyl synthetase family protein [candidate division Zixibacteria bacterium]NIV08828.1 polyprenyl synthetase family protein [candidate division Zixibacteria bacterium]
MDLPEQFKQPIESIEHRLYSSVASELPSSLREPILYFLQLPGKKIRPLMTASAAQAVGGKLEDALPAATAVELFHDFTLIHDDIMDQDELRRGYQTMHVKYDDGTAILVGDALIGLALQQLMHSPPQYLDSVVKIFTEALVKVCEGQALDKEFESRSSVSLDEYMEMIGKKTAWLFKVACSLGAICGGANQEQIELLAHYGYSLGLGFQIQDDLLDFIADESKLGKKLGSDFRMDKKTYITLKYQEILQSNSDLQKKYPSEINRFSSFPVFQQALQKIGVVDQVKAIANQHMVAATAALERVLPLDENNQLYSITRFLQERQY